MQGYKPGTKASEHFELHPDPAKKTGINGDGQVYVGIRRKGAPMHTPYTSDKLDAMVERWEASGHDPDLFRTARDVIIPRYEAEHASELEASNAHVVGGLSDEDRERRIERHGRKLGQPSGMG